MADSGQSELPGQPDRVVFGGPQRVRRDRLRHAQPFVLTRRGVAAEVEPRMVAEDLDPRPDDEGHQEEIEEVRPPDPRGHTQSGPGGLVGAGMACDEILYGWHVVQALANRHR